MRWIRKPTHRSGRCSGRVGLVSRASPTLQTRPYTAKCDGTAAWTSRPWQSLLAVAAGPRPQVDLLTLRPKQAEYLDRIGVGAAEPVRHARVKFGGLAWPELDVLRAHDQS